MGPLEITVPAGKEGTFTVLLSLARKRQNQTITDTHRITITIKKE
jgi:hypothetical protein